MNKWRQTKRLVEKHFPGLTSPIEACLAAIVTLYIKDIKDPASLILVGPPSSEKGSALNAFKGHHKTHWSDDITDAAFVSQAANMTEEQRRKIDLLPRIKDKTLIVPELAPIFSARSDKLARIIATFTRIFDGEGYWRDAGTGGGRGYRGECRFTFLGATTPPEDKLWRTLGKLGNRLCFYNMPEHDLTASQAGDFARTLREDDSYKVKLGEVRTVVNDLLGELDAVGPIDWNREDDPQELVEEISRCAELSGRLRGFIPKTRCDDGGYHRGFPVIENPKRFITLFYNLARGRALSSGRRNIDKSDLAPVRHVALSSCPYGRYRLMQYLMENGSNPRLSVETSTVENLLGCSKTYALEQMHDLETLGVVIMSARTRSAGGRSKVISLRGGFRDLLLP